MNIGIIGTGNMGGGLGKNWAAKGHRVKFGSRDPQKARPLVESAGPNASVGSISEAATFGEVVLLATPWSATTEALKTAGSLSGKVLIDCTNPLAPDFMSLAVGHTTSGAEEVARWAPGARVVKAFNTVFASVVRAAPQLPPPKPTIFCCGDDAAAKKTVAQLAGEIGFEPVDAGPLRNARYVEPTAQLLIQLGYGLGMGTDMYLKLVRI